MLDLIDLKSPAPVGLLILLTRVYHAVELGLLGSLQDLGPNRKHVPIAEFVVKPTTEFNVRDLRQQPAEKFLAKCVVRTSPSVPRVDRPVRHHAETRQRLNGQVEAVCLASHSHRDRRN